MTDKRVSYTFSLDPSGPLFEDLLNVALTNCVAGLVVVRQTLQLGSKAKSFLRRVDAFLVSTEETSNWPGTVLFEETAKVFRFTFNEPVRELLLEFSDSLFSWRQPDLPEDLCLLRPNGDPWLLTVSHESDAALLLSESEHAELSRVYPSIARRLSADAIDLSN